MKQPLKIYVGPEEVSGLMWAFRCALRKAGADARLQITKVHKYNYPYDKLYKLPYGATKPQILMGALMLPLFLRFDIYQFFSGLSLLYKNKDIPLLKFLNKTIATVFIGGDARCNTAVLNGVVDKEDCKYLPWCGEKCPLQRKIKLVKYWGDNADVIFSGVDNNQLLEFYSIPHEMLIIPCDTDHWKPFDSTYIKKPGEVLIVHAPSHRIRKGTDEIERVIKKLQGEGHNIKFKLLEEVPNSAVRQWMNVADITIDRSRGCGWYGGFATQGMSMSRPVVGYVTDACKKRSGYGSKVPIVSLEHQSLYDALMPLLDSQTLREKIGREGRSYVLAEHDDKKVGEEMLKLYTRDK